MSKTLGFRGLVYSLVLSLALPQFAFSGIKDEQWLPKNREQVRSQIDQCRVFLSPLERILNLGDKGDRFLMEEPAGADDVRNFRVNDSVGIPISTNNIEDFRASLAEIISSGRAAVFKGAKLFVNGVPMRTEDRVRAEYRKALVDAGLNPNETKFRILSIPTDEIDGVLKPRTQILIDKLKYAFPSPERDYQRPLPNEVATGIISDGFIEPPNIVYLYKNMPKLEANLVVLNHTVLLTLYSVYSQFMINWLLRTRPGVEVLPKYWPKSRTLKVPKSSFSVPIPIPTPRQLEGFMKQMLLSFPFVPNYNVFGNFSKILEYYKVHTWEATMKQFGVELANFVGTQTFTMVLQTLFYQMVMTKGIRSWQNSQVGVERSEAARGVAKIISIPFLTMDAIVLARASTPETAHSGQVMLLGLALSGLVLQRFPHLMDPAIPAYQKTLAFADSFRSYPLIQLNLEQPDSEDPLGIAAEVPR